MLQKSDNRLKFEFLSCDGLKVPLMGINSISSMGINSTAAENVG